ncbi:unnamed protein product, partial [Rotaria sp. Silwood1]
MMENIFFKAVREGDVVTFATNEENERHSWVQALYRSTGQSHKPTPPITQINKSNSTSRQKDLSDSDRSKNLGFDEYIQSDPCKFDHHDLFKTLKTATLDFRQNDPYCSLVSQYSLATCSYRERKSEPTEMMPLEGYTVDYAEPDNGKEIKSIKINKYSTIESWVQALYRAIGQSHKPTPSITQINKSNSTSGQKDLSDSDRSKNLGFDEYIQSDPCEFDHHDLFKTLQTATLDFRLNDPYCSLGWLSPGQSYVLEEYCSRYGVRGCLRYLYYLNDLLDRADQRFMIDPQFLHYSYVFCTSHVSRNRPDNNVSTITMEERDRFSEIKERLKQFLENQVTNFRFSFPFGRPEGALKAILSLLERVLSKDISTPISR